MNTHNHSRPSKEVAVTPKGTVPSKAQLTKAQKSSQHCLDVRNMMALIMFHSSGLTQI